MIDWRNEKKEAASIKNTLPLLLHSVIMSKAPPMIAGTLQTDPRSGGLKRSSGVNVLPSIAESKSPFLFITILSQVPVFLITYYLFRLGQSTGQQ